MGTTTVNNEGERLIAMMFEALELPRLQDVLDAGTLAEHIGPDDAGKLAAVTAVALYGIPGQTDQQNARNRSTLRDYFALALVNSLAENGRRRPNPDAETGEDVLTLDHQWVPITEARLRHWQWMFAILDRDDVATAFLAALPEPMRAEALANSAY